MHVLIADDNPAVRSALRLLLERKLGACVLGEVSRAAELLERVRTLRPDLLVVDCGLLENRQDTALAALRSAHPGMKIVALNGPSEIKQRDVADRVDAFISMKEQPWCVLETLSALLNSPP